MATGRAGYAPPVSGARPGRVVTWRDDHLGESAASPARPTPATRAALRRA